jgi:type VII secretion-associated protein (TIGR03931 family)
VNALVAHAGSTAVRVAGIGPDGVARVVELPPGSPVPAAVRWIGDPVAAAATGHRREVVVVDVGLRRSEVALVRAGAVAARRTGPGGAAFDAAVAGLLRERCRGRTGGPAVRIARESLSLLPEATVRSPGSAPGVVLGSGEVRAVLRRPMAEVVRAVCELAGPGRPVLLVGGGARAPLLAELLDAAGLPDVTVAPRPDAAALLAALGPAAGDHPPVADCPPVGDRRRWLPAAPRPAGRWRVALAAVAAATALFGAHLLGGVLAPAPPALPDDVLAQYGYRLQIPVGWAHTGGLPERRRSLLTPLAAPDGSDLVVVEATPLGYDSAAEPERAAAELRAAFDAAVAAGSPLSGYEPATAVGGRAVTTYSERRGATDVRWYVVLDGGTQLSVGCRHTRAGADTVLDACAAVVASIDG